MLSHQLLTTFHLDQLLQVMQDQITSLRIRNCFIVLYKTEENLFVSASEWTLPEKVDLVLAIKDEQSLLRNTEVITFPLDTLLPNGWLNTENKGNFVFLPISFKNEQYGYILLDYNPTLSVNIYDTLIIILANAIHSSLLMKKLEETVEQKTNLFINITHEMKTPLTIISSYLDKYLKRPEDINDLNVVSQNVHKLTNDMKNLLDNEKLDRGQIFYSHNKTVNLSKILLDKTMDFKEIALNENIHISVSCPSDLYIKIDPAGLDSEQFV